MQVAIAFDQLANALLGGWADETLSARAYRQSLVGPNVRRWIVVQAAINTLFFWQRHHCHESYKSEVQRKQLPDQYRGVL